jgi:hypothetical protein
VGTASSTQHPPPDEAAASASGLHPPPEVTPAGTSLRQAGFFSCRVTAGLASRYDIQAPERLYGTSS